MCERRIKDVTDDEIVDAIAEYGVGGLNTVYREDREDYDPLLLLTLELCGVADDDVDSVIEDEHQFDIFDHEEVELMDRIRKMPTRLCDPGAYCVVTLTPEEWGKRLAGKSSEEIAAAIRGDGEDIANLNHLGATIDENGRQRVPATLTREEAEQRLSGLSAQARQMVDLDSPRECLLSFEACLRGGPPDVYQARDILRAHVTHLDGQKATAPSSLEETARLHAVIAAAANALADACHGDHEHQIECHPDGLPAEHRRVAAAAERALEILSPVVVAMVEPPAPTPETVLRAMLAAYERDTYSACLDYFKTTDPFEERAHNKRARLLHLQCDVIRREAAGVAAGHPDPVSFDAPIHDVIYPDRLMADYEARLAGKVPLDAPPADGGGL